MKTWYNNDAAWHYIEIESEDVSKLVPTTIWVLKRIKLAKKLIERLEKDLQKEVDNIGDYTDVDSKAYDLGLVEKARMASKNALEILGASFVRAWPRVYRGEASITMEVLINISVMVSDELRASAVTGLKSFRIRPFPEDFGDLIDDGDITDNEYHEVEWAYDCRHCYR